MNRTILAVFAALTLIVAPGTIGAAVIQTQPSIMTGSPGNEVSIPIVLDTGTTTDRVYTLQMEVEFPSYLMQLASWDLNPNIKTVPISVSPYSLTDNQYGKITRTVGFPGGISGPTLVGTLRFRLTDEGGGVVLVSTSSKAYNQNNVDVLENRIFGFPVASFKGEPFSGTGGPDDASQGISIDVGAKSKSTGSVIKSSPKIAKAEPVVTILDTSAQMEVATSTDVEATSTLAIATGAEGIDESAAVAGSDGGMSTRNKIIIAILVLAIASPLAWLLTRTARA